MALRIRPGDVRDRRCRPRRDDRTISVFLLLAVANFPGTNGFPRSVFFIEGILNLALVGGGRFLLRASLERKSGGTGIEPAVLTLIYGAGEAGATLARLAERSPAARIRVVGFLDDDTRKRDSRMLGHRVFGSLDQLESAASRTGAEQLLIAMPSAPGTSIRRALEAGQALELDVRTVPPLRELVSGQVLLSKVRPVRVDDLLRRQPVEIDMNALAGALNGKSVLVTGGGGSIGSELVRQILALGPRQLTIADNHEWALWAVERQTSETGRSIDGAQPRGHPRRHSLGGGGRRGRPPCQAGHRLPRGGAQARADGRGGSRWRRSARTSSAPERRCRRATQRASQRSCSSRPTRRSTRRA